MFGLQFINEVDNFQRQMNQILHGAHQQGHHRNMDLQVSEDEKGFKVRAVLPGLDVEKMDISILGRQLKIAGDFVQEELPESAHCYRQERNRGAFEKILQLTSHLDADKVEAEYRNGILEIQLPKAASALPKKITVNAG